MSFYSLFGVKRPERDADYPSLSEANMKGRVELYPFSFPEPLWSVLGRTLPFHAMMVYKVVEVWLHLTLALDGRKWSASRLCLFCPRHHRKCPSTHIIEDWMGPESMSGHFVGDENLFLNSTNIPLV